jgi:hypothetical protein
MENILMQENLAKIHQNSNPAGKWAWQGAMAHLV